MSIRRYLALCITLLIVISSATISVAQDSSSSSTGVAGPPTITRVSGCTDVGDVTINCPRGTQLLITLYGSNFFNINDKEPERQSWGFSLEQNTPIGNRVAQSPLRYPKNDTCIVFIYNGLEYGRFMNNNFLNVTLQIGNQQIAPSFTSLSFAAPVPLFLTRITGCPTISTDGLVASGCNYLNPITIIGSGFGMIGVDSVELTFGSLLIRDSLSPNSASRLRIVDDSTMLFDPTVFDQGIPLEIYNGAAMKLHVTSAWSLWNLTSVSVSYPSMPSIVVSRIVSANSIGCDSSSFLNDTLSLTGCFAGRSTIWILGHYISTNTQVWIGDFLIPSDLTTIDDIRSDIIEITLPILDTQEGVYYNIKIVNPVTNLVLKNVINIVSTPEIANTTLCVQKLPDGRTSSSSVWKAFCLEGEIFSFTVVNMHGRSAPRVWFGPYECPNVRVIDDRIVQCTVPRDPDGTASVRDGLFLSWPDYNSSAVNFELWDYPYAPRVTELTGPSCYQSSDLTKPLQCLFDPLQGINVTVSTSRLARSQRWQCILYFSRNTVATVEEDVVVDEFTGTVTCPLRWAWLANRAMQLQVSVIGRSGDYGSNLKSIVMVSRITYDVNSSSDSKTLTIALCIVLPLVFVLVVVSALYWRRHTRVAKSNGSIDLDDSMSSDAIRHIELA